MIRIVIRHRLLFTLFSAVLAQSLTANAAGTGQQLVSQAGSNDQFAFIMFYRGNNIAARKMHGVLKSALAGRRDAAIIPVRVSDVAEQELVKRFDATRMPLPAVAVLAPNGAVCSVFPRRVSEKQLVAAIVSPGQAECLKALQDKKIVLLCAQPEMGTAVPTGVRDFQADDLFRNRTKVVTVSASDPVEARFLQQLRVKTDQATPIVAFMAPPGVMLGVFDADVTLEVLAQKLAAAGKCCDDENCRHHKTAVGRQRSRR